MCRKRTYIFQLILILLCSNAADSAIKKIVVSKVKEVVCFIYHRFGDSRYPSTNTTIKDFESHLSYLKQNNFRVITFSEAIAYLQSKEPIQKTAVITIDDGYSSFYKNGLPLLQKYKMPATLFINTKTVGGGDYMNWTELEIAIKNNIEIGNHTHTHNYFMNEPTTSRYQTFKKEIELSQSIIFSKLHLTPHVFSYPYGEFDNEMKRIVKATGFIAAAAQNSGVLDEKADLFQCPRFPMSEAYSSRSKFIEKVKTRSLEIIDQSPDNSMMINTRPILTLTFDAIDLKLDQLQCFVQSGESKVSIDDSNRAMTTIRIQALKPISKRRRTLYTVTVPDKNGIWHWHSHLWINTKVK